MAPTNRGIVYVEPGLVEVQTIPYPQLKADQYSPIYASHGIILRVITASISESDCRNALYGTSLRKGEVLGHEVTGEVVEKGQDVEFLRIGDLCSVPLNIACGRCRNCKQGKTHTCLTIGSSLSPPMPGRASAENWTGGQSEYVVIPYADFNILKFPDKDQAMEKIQDLTLLSDVFPTGYHGAISAGVGVGSTVYVAGANSLGLACAAASRFVGDDSLWFPSAFGN
jgi:glutathione-independent formaldehyde dehydrogenase